MRRSEYLVVADTIRHSPRIHILLLDAICIWRDEKRHFGQLCVACAKFCENESLVVCVKSLFAIPHTLEEHMLAVEKVVNDVIVADCYGRELSSWCRKDPSRVVVFVQ